MNIKVGYETFEKVDKDCLKELFNRNYVEKTLYGSYLEVRKWEDAQSFRIDGKDIPIEILHKCIDCKVAQYKLDVIQPEETLLLDQLDELKEDYRPLDFIYMATQFHYDAERARVITDKLKFLSENKIYSTDFEDYADWHIVKDIEPITAKELLDFYIRKTWSE